MTLNYVNESTNDEFEKIQKMVMEFGLTLNQSKVFLYLTRTGAKTASDVSKNLKIPRTETYHLLNSLQQKGIIISIFGKPTKFKALSIGESIQVLLNNEKTRLNDLESKKPDLIKLWSGLPRLEWNEDDVIDAKFQILQGRNSILVKLEQMIKSANTEIQIIGSEADFIKFYHTNFVEYLIHSKINLKILTTFSKKGNYIFEKIPYEKLKKLNESENGKFCFIVKDTDEVVFFMNNLDFGDMIAIWTDAKPFITTLKSLFSLIWKKSPSINEFGELDNIYNTDFDHKLKEIEQEKIIIDYLHHHIPKFNQLKLK